MVETDTVKKLLRTYLVLLISVFACIPFVAEATSPCKGDGCIDEASANLVAPYDILGMRCAQVDPENAKQYYEMARAAFAKEDPDFLTRLRASEVYSKVKKELELKADNTEKKEVVTDCKRFLMSQ